MLKCVLLCDTPVNHAICKALVRNMLSTTAAKHVIRVEGGSPTFYVITTSYAEHACGLMCNPVAVESVSREVVMCEVHMGG